MACWHSCFPVGHEVNNHPPQTHCHDVLYKHVKASDHGLKSSENISQKDSVLPSEVLWVFVPEESHLAGRATDVT